MAHCTTNAKPAIKLVLVSKPGHENFLLIFSNTLKWCWGNPALSFLHVSANELYCNKYVCQRWIGLIRRDTTITIRYIISTCSNNHQRFPIMLPSQWVTVSTVNLVLIVLSFNVTRQLFRQFRSDQFISKLSIIKAVY